jgi:hypothetical protein
MTLEQRRDMRLVYVLIGLILAAGILANLLGIVRSAQGASLAAPGVTVTNPFSALRLRARKVGERARIRPARVGRQASAGMHNSVAGAR